MIYLSEFTNEEKTRRYEYHWTETSVVMIFFRYCLDAQWRPVSQHTYALVCPLP